MNFQPNVAIVLQSSAVVIMRRRCLSNSIRSVYCNKTVEAILGHVIWHDLTDEHSGRDHTQKACQIFELPTVRHYSQPVNGGSRYSHTDY